MVLLLGHETVMWQLKCGFLKQKKKKSSPFEVYICLLNSRHKNQWRDCQDWCIRSKAAIYTVWWVEDLSTTSQTCILSSVARTSATGTDWINCMKPAKETTKNLSAQTSEGTNFY